MRGSIRALLAGRDGDEGGVTKNEDGKGEDDRFGQDDEDDPG